MVRHSNYWFETCPTRKQISAGIVRNVDVLIIGGGIAGMSLLHRLVTGGVTNTFLVEASTVAFHSSGRSSGQLVYRGLHSFASMPDDVAEEYIEFICGNNKRLLNGLRNVGFDTDLRESGGLRLAVDEDEMAVLEHDAELFKARGIDCPILSGADVERLLPSKAFIGGMFMPNEATFNPYKVVNGMMDLIEKQGVRVLTGTQVESVTEKPDGSLAVSIRHRGVINAKQVVYCTNAYSSALLPELAPVITPFRGQMVATDYLPEATLSVLPAMSMMCNHGSEYFRLHGGRLLVGGMRHAIRGRQEGTLYDGETSPTVYDKLRQFVSNALPFVSTNFTHTWSGVMCATQDGMPLVGALPNRPNEFIMAGFNGYGFSHALLSSMIIRDLIRNGESKLPGARIFDPARLLKEEHNV